ARLGKVSASSKTSPARLPEVNTRLNATAMVMGLSPMKPAGRSLPVIRIMRIFAGRASGKMRPRS
ncbi:hypothetical protein EBR96_07850, partial [bacterium]|nr:hypothetical protein [bacterium]